MKKLKGIYLASYKAYHPGYNIIYQDINGLRDIGGDMLNIELSEYDFVIATPPCNYWSRANYRREYSLYSQKTKHLLPGIIDKLKDYKKPFIIENVINKPLFYKNNVLPQNNICVYYIGRHIYFTNILFNTYINQEKENIQYLSSSDRQGNNNVFYVIDRFLKCIHNDDYININN